MGTTRLQRRAPMRRGLHQGSLCLGVACRGVAPWHFHVWNEIQYTFLFSVLCCGGIWGSPIGRRVGMYRGDWLLGLGIGKLALILGPVWSRRGAVPDPFVWFGVWMYPFVRSINDIFLCMLCMKWKSVRVYDGFDVRTIVAHGLYLAASCHISHLILEIVSLETWKLFECWPSFWLIRTLYSRTMSWSLPISMNWNVEFAHGRRGSKTIVMLASLAFIHNHC